MDPAKTQLIQEASLLSSRLERLSADSHWAHQASGLRGSLLRCLETLLLEDQTSPAAQAALEQAWQSLPDLLARGQFILHNAARAIRTPDTQFD